MHKLSGVTKSNTESTEFSTEGAKSNAESTELSTAGTKLGPTGMEVSTEDAYAALAPDPIASTNDARRERDWFAEFSDESQAPAEKSQVWRALGESLKNEES